mmetsp:Transcript_49959/g.104262  ORF Transcript_49959/g.104262 Transcript_49959/m.104262 type:complete len:218 (-) Transcript_49959:193-846(-)
MAYLFRILCFVSVATQALSFCPSSISFTMKERTLQSSGRKYLPPFGGIVCKSMIDSSAELSRRQVLAGILGLLPASSYAADASGVSSKPIILESGLAYVEKKKKDGLLASVEQKVAQGDLVIVDYIAYLRDGTIFDNTKKRGKPVAFQVGKKQVIPGLEQGLLGMKAGEERQLFVPARLGYGSRGVCLEDNKGCLVPPNTDLVYDVALLRVAPSPLP